MATGIAPGLGAAGLNPSTGDERHAAEDGRVERRLQQVISQIEDSLRGLRYGQVTITVQDGVVVQIDRLERTRIVRSVE